MSATLATLARLPATLQDGWLRLTARNDLPLRGDDTGRFLPWVVAVMVFLGTLALAAALAVGAAASRWQHDLSGSATVQIAALDPRGGGNLDSRVATALDLLRRTPGIRQADPISQEAAAALLTPWLGDIATLGDLPMPRLIDVSFDLHQVDTAELGRALAAAVPGASFDDHRRWVEGPGAARALGDPDRDRHRHPGRRRRHLVGDLRGAQRAGGASRGDRGAASDRRTRRLHRQ
ncbi:MAG: hypothetical protein WDO24_21390 [Pseudomonadota bacterium]